MLFLKKNPPYACPAASEKQTSQKNPESLDPESNSAATWDMHHLQALHQHQQRQVQPSHLSDVKTAKKKKGKVQQCRTSNVLPTPYTGASNAIWKLHKNAMNRSDDERRPLGYAVLIGRCAENGKVRNALWELHTRGCRTMTMLCV